MSVDNISDIEFKALKYERLKVQHARANKNYLIRMKEKNPEKYNAVREKVRVNQKKYRDRQREKKKQLKEATATPKVIIIDEKNEP